MVLRKYLPVIGMSAIGKALLLGSGAMLVALAVLWYGNILPLGMSDFLFLFVLVTLAATYRPGWAFLLLVSVLPIEIVNLAPDSLHIGIRPYQLLVLSIFVAIGMRFIARRAIPEIPKPNFGDFLLFLIPVGSLFAIVNASDPGRSFRLSVILFSYFALYALFRIFVRTAEDVGRILPFVIASLLLTSVVAVVQNVAFLSGNGFFEIMPGRPNGLFPEPDWLGLFLISAVSVFSAIGYFIASRTVSYPELFRMKRAVFVSLSLVMIVTALILTVSRSAWLGAAIVACAAALLAVFTRRFRVAGMLMILFGFGSLFAFALVELVPLSDFDLSGRAGSIGSGLQTITVSCEQETALPEHIVSVDELAVYGCRHIDLDEIETERAAGRFVSTIDRNDPNVSIRRQIYQKSIALGMTHALLGVGWGTVGDTLGHDERGAGLNASDVFLEVWLGSGAIGLVGLIGFLLLLAIRAVRDFFRSRGTFPFFLLVSFAGVIVSDLFNSGIMLAFVWALLGIAGSYLFHESDYTETL
ncbi:MAG: O-antigen ligase family protein [Candidatus Moraniibacteriota bacterium]